MCVLGCSSTISTSSAENGGGGGGEGNRVASRAIFHPVLTVKIIMSGKINNTMSCRMKERTPTTHQRVTANKPTVRPLDSANGGMSFTSSGVDIYSLSERGNGILLARDSRRRLLGNVNPHPPTAPKTAKNTKTEERTSRRRQPENNIPKWLKGETEEETFHRVLLLFLHLSAHPDCGVWVFVLTSNLADDDDDVRM